MIQTGLIVENVVLELKRSLLRKLDKVAHTAAILGDANRHLELVTKQLFRDGLQILKVNLSGLLFLLLGVTAPRRGRVTVGGR